METRLADVCSRTAVRSRLNRYLCKWLSIILSGQSGEQLQRNCMSREIICISLRANYWLSCLRGFNRRPAVGYSFVFFFKKPAFEAFFCILAQILHRSRRWCFHLAGKLCSKVVICHISHLSVALQTKDSPPFGASLRFLFFQLKAYMW